MFISLWPLSCYWRKLIPGFVLKGISKEVVGVVFERPDKDVERVLPGGHASWKELEKESAVR